MQDIYESPKNYTFIDDISQYSEKYITDKFYKPIFEEGNKTIRPYDEVLTELKKHIPIGLKFDNDTFIGGGFLLKLVCKQFNLDDYPNTDIDIFTVNYKTVKEYFENYDNSEIILTAEHISEFKLKNFKYNFQIINARHFNPDQFDFGHNEIYFKNNIFYGTSRFIEFIKYQISECVKICPERIIKALEYNLRLVSDKMKFDFYPDIFEKVKVQKGEDIDNYQLTSKYKIKFDKIIPEKHLEHWGHIKGGFELSNIEKKYYNSEYHFNILKYVKKHYPNYLILKNIIEFCE